MSRVLNIDFETRSTVNLPKTGVYVYAADPTTDIWLMAWSFDGEEPQLWTPAQAGLVDVDDENGDSVQVMDAGLPPEITEHIFRGGEIRAWNAQFERVLWREIMVKRYGAIAVKNEQWHDTAAEAAAMALPRALEDAARVLGVEAQKDMKGKGLMMRMARPRRVEEDGTIVWWDDDPEKLHTLGEYCKQDVRTEQAVAKRVRRLTPLEREVYLMDQRMNDRGIRVDTELVRAAQDVIDTSMQQANERMLALTGGAVTKVTNHTQLRAWLASEGLETEGVGKPAVAAILEDEALPAKLREVLEERQDSGRSSVAKLRSMLLATGSDEMARGLALYHGASTGRWTGKLIQPHNFPRGEVKNIESYIPLVRVRAIDVLNLMGSPIVIVLSMLRSMLTARLGYDLLAGDYSAVEARVLNWLAGEDEVVDSFRAMDRGDKTKHPYKRMAVAMGRAASTDGIEKGSDDYQAGKAAELGCGFGMGAAKFITAAWQVYKVRVTEQQSKVAVDAYRASHPRVKAFWYETEDAVKEAINTPGVPVKFGARRNLTALKAGAYLYVILPSGRPLVYAAPVIRDEPTPWDATQLKPTVTFMGIAPYAPYEWTRLRTYGGALVENIVQAVARDLLAEAKLRLEKAGYLPVLSVHDEVVAEVPEHFGSIEEFESIMAELPSWAEGLPVAVEAWRGFRYRK